MRRFVLRAIGTLLVVGGVTAGVAYQSFGWGSHSVSVVLWAMVVAFAMGLVGYRSARAGILRSTPQTTGVMVSLLGGMALCALILVVSCAAVFALAGSPWTERALVLSTLYYVVMIFVKVITLSGEMKRAGETRRANENLTSQPAQNGVAGGEG